MKLAFGAVVWATGLALASTAGAAEFTAKPTAAMDGKNTVITFAVDKPCDVAVAVVDNDGKVVRHLAAGVLGQAAPAPFKPGAAALEQAVAWDGNDDFGKALPAGAYKVRVRLGLGVKLDKVIGDEGRPILTLNALAVGPKGELYVCQGSEISIYDRDGKYLRQVMPFPASLPLDKLAGLDPVKLPGDAFFCRRPYPGGKGTGEVIGSMAVSPDGKTLYLPGPPRYARNLIRIGTDGSVPANAFDTRLTTLADNGYLWLACSPDGKTLYVSGAQAGYEGDDARALSYRHSVYRLKLDSSGPAESFTGDDENVGADGFYVSTPKGLATDPAGRVYVCNFSGGNVAVYTPGAGFLKSFKVESPQQVAVNPKTGQLYVLCGRESSRVESGYRHAEVMHEAKIVRLSADGKVEKELALDPPATSKRKNQETGEFFRQPEFRLRMAADFSEPAKPVLWVGVTAPEAWYCKWGLLRIEDLGDTFGEPRDVCPHGAGAVPGSMNRMCLDRERDILYLSNGTDSFKRYDALDGTLMEPIRVKGSDGADAKVSIAEQAVGPGGVLYFLGSTAGSNMGCIFRAGPMANSSPIAAGQPGNRRSRPCSKDPAAWPSRAAGRSTRSTTTATARRTNHRPSPGTAARRIPQPWPSSDRTARAPRND